MRTRRQVPDAAGEVFAGIAELPARDHGTPSVTDTSAWNRVEPTKGRTRTTMLRVETGDAAPEEVAALTAILPARATARTPAATWRGRRRERRWRSPAFRAPRSRQA